MQKSREAWVIDASVAAKWYLRDESLTPQADSVWKEIEGGRISGLAPHIACHELASSLSTACWSGRITKENAQRELANYIGTGLSAAADPDWLISDTASIAMDLRVALYDSVYLAMARRLSAKFVTADERLCNAVTKNFAFVTYLGNISVP